MTRSDMYYTKFPSLSNRGLKFTPPKACTSIPFISLLLFDYFLHSYNNQLSGSSKKYNVPMHNFPYA